MPGPTSGPVLCTVRQDLYERNIEYCWLDIFCLRQQDGIGEQQRRQEWKIDVPTIGNIYRNAFIIVRYLNGLGQQVNNHVAAWREPRHWTNRAWTLQEIKPDDQMATPNQTGELNLMQVVEGTNPPLTVRQLLHPISRIAATAHSSRGCGIISLVREITRRSASTPLDKVAGISYLMWPRGSRFDLPIYDEKNTEEAAWLKSVDLMRLELKLELLFLYPNPRADTFLMTNLDIISKLRNDHMPERLTIWQGLLKGGSPQWIPTLKQLEGSTIDSFWDELTLPTLSELRLSYTRHPLLVPTYFSGLKTPFRTFVLENCILWLDGTDKTSTHKHKFWGITTSVSKDEEGLEFAGYAPIDTVLKPSDASYAESKHMGFVPSSPPQSPSHDAREALPLDFMDLTGTPLAPKYFLLGLSLDVQAPWLVCLAYMDAMSLRTRDDSFTEVSSIAKGITVYSRTLMLQKVAVLWTDERLLLARALPQTMPWPKRDYDAIYIV